MEEKERKLGDSNRLNKVLTIDVKKEKCGTGVSKKYVCTYINWKQNLSYIRFTRVTLDDKGFVDRYLI